MRARSAIERTFRAVRMDCAAGMTCSVFDSTCVAANKQIERNPGAWIIEPRSQRACSSSDINFWRSLKPGSLIIVGNCLWRNWWVAEHCGYTDYEALR